MMHDTDPSSHTIDKGNKLDESEIQRVVEYYEAAMKEKIRGPQLEGFEGSQIAEALREQPENAFLIEMPHEQGETMKKWPLLVPVEYHQDYSKRFFDDHYPNKNAYYFSLPPHENVESLLTSSEVLEAIAQFLGDKEVVVAYDYQEGTRDKEIIPAFIEEICTDREINVEDITPESKAWGMEYGLPLALHYEGVAYLANREGEAVSTVSEAIEKLIASGEVQRLPETGAAFLGREELLANNGEFLEQLWNVYDEQFDELVEDHPVLGKQPREEFEAMLLDEDTVNVAFIYEGKAAGLLYMVHDIKKCVWLNANYYDEKFQSEGEHAWMTHVPGIVVAKDKAQQGVGYAQEMLGMLLKVTREMGKDMIITFACSNVSSQYIPKMVNRAVRDSPDYRFDDNKEGVDTTAEYGYRILEVSPKAERHTS